MNTAWDCTIHVRGSLKNTGDCICIRRWLSVREALDCITKEYKSRYDHDLSVAFNTMTQANTRLLSSLFTRCCKIICKLVIASEIHGLQRLVV